MYTDKLLVGVTSIHKGVLFQWTWCSSCDSLLMAVHQAGDSQFDDIMALVKFLKVTLTKT